MKKYIDIRKMQHYQINSSEKFEVATGELQTFIISITMLIITILIIIT